MLFEVYSYGLHPQLLSLLFNRFTFPRCINAGERSPFQDLFFSFLDFLFLATN